MSCEYVKNQKIDKLDSFIGGIPYLPNNIEIPKCKLCQCEQTFFFQITFPEVHKWFGKTFAVFNCTSCVEEDFLIPEMLDNELYNINIPEGFLESYQKNFSFIVFETKLGIQKCDYMEKIKYQPIFISSHDEENTLFGKMSKNPDWLLEDESPSKYDGLYNMSFLFQLNHSIEFYIIETAPRQVELDLAGNPCDSPYEYYQLFLGSEIYFFGVENYKSPLVYAITQI